jgi:hypothetical protein
MRTLKLTRRERRDVRVIAVRARLAQPTSMLLSPAALSAAVDAALGERGKPALRQRMGQLATRLFGGEALILTTGEE